MTKRGAEKLLDGAPSKKEKIHVLTFEEVIEEVSAGHYDNFRIWANQNQIHKLDLSYSRAMNIDLSHLILALEGTGVEYLDLARNQIGAKRAEALAKALATNTTLRGLDLTTNDLGVEGAHALALALEQNTTLESLNVGNNHLGDSGARDFALALEKNNTLQFLNLYYNQIGPQGAQALASTLTKLLSLDLSHNHLGGKGVQALLSGVDKGKITLQTLGLTGVSLNMDGILPIVKLLKKSNLKKLDLGANSISAADFKLLVEALTDDAISLSLENLKIHSFYPEVISLLKNSSLKKLCLHPRNIHNNEIFEVVAFNTILESLVLFKLTLTKESLRLILENNKTLKAISTPSSDFNSYSSLLVSFQRNRSLQKLSTTFTDLAPPELQTQLDANWSLAINQETSLFKLCQEQLRAQQKTFKR